MHFVRLSARTSKVLSHTHHVHNILNYNFKKCFHLSISDLSSDLVGRLQARDQLRTEQDAMLLEVQDLTSQ